MRSVVFYFDFVSPYAYLAQQRLAEVPARIEYRPVLFAGVLAQWGQKGPAEITPKRKFTYRYCQWRADALGIPFHFPAQHPFNPLHHLRLAIAAGATPPAVQRIFEALWTDGADAADPAAFESLCRELRVEAAALSAPAVKDALRENTEQAVVQGVFGVPTFEADGELFWGLDSIAFLRDYLENPAILASAEMKRVDALPVGAARKPT